MGTVLLRTLCCANTSKPYSYINTRTEERIISTMDSWKYKALMITLAVSAEVTKRLGLTEFGAKDIWEWKNACEEIYSLLPGEIQDRLRDAVSAFLNRVIDLFTPDYLVQR